MILDYRMILEKLNTSQINELMSYLKEDNNEVMSSMKHFNFKSPKSLNTSGFHKSILKSTITNFLISDIPLFRNQKNVSFEDLSKSLRKKLLFAKEILTQTLHTQSHLVIKDVLETAKERECCEEMVTALHLLYEIDTQYVSKSHSGSDYFSRIQQIIDIKIIIEDSLRLMRLYIQGDSSSMIQLDVLVNKLESGMFKDFQTHSNFLQEIHAVLKKFEITTDHDLINRINEIESKYFGKVFLLPNSCFRVFVRIKILTYFRNKHYKDANDIINRLESTFHFYWKEYYVNRIRFENGNFNGILRSFNAATKSNLEINSRVVLLSAGSLFTKSKFKECKKFIDSNLSYCKGEREASFGMRMLNLLCEFELGKFYLFEYSIQNLRKYVMANKDELSTVQHKILLLLENFLRSDFKIKNLKDKHKALISDIASQSSFIQFHDAGTILFNIWVERVVLKTQTLRLH